MDPASGLCPSGVEVADTLWAKWVASKSVTVPSNVILGSCSIDMYNGSCAPNCKAVEIT